MQDDHLIGSQAHKGLDSNSKKIVIIGGGFAGVKFCQTMMNQDGYEVVLVDRNSYHFFPPLIYQVATGFLEPASIAYPFRKLLRSGKNIRYVQGEMISVNTEHQCVHTSNGDIMYDELIIATGAQTNFFGMSNIEKHALPMKTMSDALYLRNMLLNRLEMAARSNDLEQQMRLLTLVIAGGGPTGVELAGVFSELRRRIILKDYPEFARLPLAPIILITAGSTVLEPMSEKSQTYTTRQLIRKGVKVVTNTFVTDFDGVTIQLSSGDAIESVNLIWASGVIGQKIEGIDQQSYGTGNRLLVNQNLQVSGYSNIHALGDCCVIQDDLKYPKGHPQMGQPALQQGQHIAQQFINRKKNKDNTPFDYHDKGSMAMIGRQSAVADLANGIHFNGVMAWWVWLLVHLMALVNFRNRVKTFYNWTTAFITSDTHFRMIFYPRAHQQELDPVLKKQPQPEDNAPEH